MGQIDVFESCNCLKFNYLSSRTVSHGIISNVLSSPPSRETVVTTVAIVFLLVPMQACLQKGTSRKTIERPYRARFLGLVAAPRERPRWVKPTAEPILSTDLSVANTAESATFLQNTLQIAKLQKLICLAL